MSRYHSITFCLKFSLDIRVQKLQKDNWQGNVQEITFLFYNVMMYPKNTKNIFTCCPVEDDVLTQVDSTEDGYGIDVVSMAYIKDILAISYGSISVTGYT